jgi:hypothetical protein
MTPISQRTGTCRPPAYEQTLRLAQVSAQKPGREPGAPGQGLTKTPPKQSRGRAPSRVMAMRWQERPAGATIPVTHSGIEKSQTLPAADPPDLFPPCAPAIVLLWPVPMKNAYSPGFKDSSNVTL